MTRTPGVRTVWAMLAALAAGVCVPLVISGAPQQATAPAQQPSTAAPPPRGNLQPSFRAGVDIVSLNVTVMDPAQKYVIDLAQDEFQVYEDGVKQEVMLFNRTNLPIALSLLVDTSASMEQRLPIAQEAAIGFAHKLRAQDLAEIIDFDSRVMVLQSFTNKASDLESAIRRTSAGGSTSMYNAIYIALKDLKKAVATTTGSKRYNPK